MRRAFRTHPTTRRRHWLRAACLGLVLTGSSALTAGDTGPSFASVSWSSDQIGFVAQTGGEFLLTVTGSVYAHRERGAGALSFRPIGEDGSTLPDGGYRFELREILAPSNAEETSGVVFAPPARRPRIERARFRIVGGAIVPPPITVGSDSDGRVER